MSSALRVWVCFRYNPLDYLFSDPARHWANAGRFLKPDFFGALDPIGYQTYLWVVRCVTADNRVLVAGTCATLSVLMPWVYYRAARELGMSKVASLAAWALIGFTPSLVAIYHYTMMETLLLPLVGLGLWLSARHLRQQTVASFSWAMAVWCMAVLTKTTVAPLAAACMGFVWWRTGKSPRMAIVAAALAMVALVPNALRTYLVLGFPAPLGNIWPNKIYHRSDQRDIEISWGKSHYWFSSPSCHSRPLAPLSPWFIERAGEKTSIKVVADPAHGARDWEDAFSTIRIGITDGRWWRQGAENVILFLFGQSWPDSDRGETMGYLNELTRWAWAPILFVVFDLNWTCFRRTRRLHLIMVGTTALALFLTFQNMALMEGRYRKPLEPLLLLNLVWATECLRKNPLKKSETSPSLPSRA